MLFQLLLIFIDYNGYFLATFHIFIMTLIRIVMKPPGTFFIQLKERNCFIPEIIAFLFIVRYQIMINN